jgi:hypothetical protein
MIKLGRQAVDRQELRLQRWAEPHGGLASRVMLGVSGTTGVESICEQLC